MALLTDIEQTDWSFSNLAFGEVVQGINDINQCIANIFQTVKGSDPFRPEFGCNLSKFIDQPSNIAIPNIIKSMADAIFLWEPRINLTEIKYQIKPEKTDGTANDGSQVTFTIIWDMVIKKGSKVIDFKVTSGGVTPTSFGFDYTLDFQIN